MLKSDNGVPFQITDAVKINLGGFPILVPYDSLDGSDRNIVAIHDGSPRMTNWVEPKIFYTLLRT